MKPMENTEDFVKRGKAKVTTDPRMDQRVLGDAFAVMNETITKSRSSVALVILKSRAMRIAAAAVVIVAIGLLSLQSNPSEQEQQPVPKTAKSPTEMLSAMSLNMAYRRGGIEALDDLSHEAFGISGAQPSRVSVRELRSESNGV